jgi:membrane-associated PAP2 superfamily phosphatase
MSKRFGYWRDPVGLVAGTAYAANRWLVPRAWQAPWWRGHFADVLLIPVGLPCWLWLERRIGWRRDDRVPRWREIAFVLITWTIAAELIAPRMFARATADGWDAVAYLGGAIVAGLLWQRAAS